MLEALFVLLLLGPCYANFIHHGPHGHPRLDSWRAEHDLQILAAFHRRSHGEDQIQSAESKAELLLFVKGLLTDCADIPLSECLENQKYNTEILNAVHPGNQSATGKTAMQGNCSETTGAGNVSGLDKEGDGGTKEEEDGGGVQERVVDTMERLMVAVVLGCMGACAYLMYNRMDDAPEWLINHVVRLVGGKPEQVLLKCGLG